MTLVFLARQSKAMLSVTQEAVNLDSELGLNILSTFYAFAWLCMKISSENLVLVVLLQTEAKDLILSSRLTN